MEDMQKALNHLCDAIRETRNLGVDEHNSILELRLIERKGAKDMFGRSLQDGMYVRPIWSHNPNRDDGYYDIPVDGCNTMGVLCSVWDFLRRY